MISEHLHNLIFGLATAFVLPIVGFVLGMIFSRILGGWRVAKIRRWWTIFCLSMPFVFLGMMITRMAEDHFEGIRSSWSAEPKLLLIIIAFGVLLSTTTMLALLRAWHRSNWNGS